MRGTPCALQVAREGCRGAAGHLPWTLGRDARRSKVPRTTARRQIGASAPRINFSGRFLPFEGAAGPSYINSATLGPTNEFFLE